MRPDYVLPDPVTLAVPWWVISLSVAVVAFVFARLNWRFTGHSLLTFGVWMVPWMIDLMFRGVPLWTYVAAFGAGMLWLVITWRQSRIGECQHLNTIHRDFLQPSPTYQECLDCCRIRFLGTAAWRTEVEIDRDIARMLRRGKL